VKVDHQIAASKQVGLDLGGDTSNRGIAIASETAKEVAVGFAGVSLTCFASERISCRDKDDPSLYITRLNLFGKPIKNDLPLILIAMNTCKYNDSRIIPIGDQDNGDRNISVSRLIGSGPDPQISCALARSDQIDTCHKIHVFPAGIDARPYAIPDVFLVRRLRHESRPWLISDGIRHCRAMMRPGTRGASGPRSSAHRDRQPKPRHSVRLQHLCTQLPSSSRPAADGSCKRLVVRTRLIAARHRSALIRRELIFNRCPLR
jgi:hypothetical protein